MRIGPISVVDPGHMVYARDSVAGVSVATAQFKLETYDSPNGRGVRFVQPKGKTLLQMAEAINAASQKLYNRNAIDQGNLLKDYGMKTNPEKEIVHDFIPVVKGSNNKIRNEQGEYLEGKGMSFADRAEITIAAGLLRLREGFPQRGLLGSPQDKGDLLQGKVVRARSGALSSYAYGVCDCAYYYDFCGAGAADTFVFAAGLPNFKS